MMLGLLNAWLGVGRRPIAVAISYSVAFRFGEGVGLAATPLPMANALLAGMNRFAHFGRSRGLAPNVVRTSTHALLPFGSGDISTLTVSSLTPSSNPGSPFGVERLRMVSGTRVRSLTRSASPTVPVALYLNPVLRGFELPPSFSLPPGIALLSPNQLAVKVDAFVISISGHDERSESARAIARFMKQIHYEDCMNYAIFERVVDGRSRGFMGMNVDKTSGNNLTGHLRGLVTHPDSRGVGTELLELAVNLMAGRELRAHPASSTARDFFVGRGFEIVPFTDEVDLALTAAHSDQWSGQDNAWRWKKKS